MTGWAIPQPATGMTLSASDGWPATDSLAASYAPRTARIAMTRKRACTRSRRGPFAATARASINDLPIREGPHACALRSELSRVMDELIGLKSPVSRGNVKKTRALLGGMFSGCVALLSACGSSSGGDGYGEDVNQPPPAAIVTIGVAPTTVAQGQEAVLTWTSNAAMCMAGGAWTGAQASSGTL